MDGGCTRTYAYLGSHAVLRVVYLPTPNKVHIALVYVVGSTGSVRFQKLDIICSNTCEDVKKNPLVYQLLPYLSEQLPVYRFYRGDKNLIVGT